MTDHDDFGGLQRDLLATGAAMDRRDLFRLAARFGGAVGALQLLGCGGSPTQASSATAALPTTITTTPTGGSCSRVPEETQGPYPGDGSNGPNVLNATGVVRTDIRSSFAGLSGVADGVPLTLELTIVSASTCAPLDGRAVYLWHGGVNRNATSQIALPKAACDLVYATAGYESSVTNLRGVTLATDNVFSDGPSLELATVNGSVAGGLVASLTVGV